MNAVLQPLFWRLANEQNSGLDVVSVLMPRGDEADRVAIEYAIDVSFKPSNSHQNPIDLRWSEDDSELFMSLLRKVLNVTDKDIELDIEDGMVQSLINLVATARFHTPWPGDELEGEDFMTYRKEIEVGDLISLNTKYGFYSAVIVALDSIDATVVLLDDIVSPDSAGLPEDEQDVIMPSHSLLMLNRVCVLPAEFAEDVDASVLH
ncbi:MAG TPA: hypothetical protein DIC30_09885 [Oceanospirillales bacterium]|nr:hypothetical protein [Oceanospirillales bacterium]|tara:strand:+ start:1123 stop:1740 length:618 start_codon:yes stop_codon:yes gene_type:complete